MVEKKTPTEEKLDENDYEAEQKYLNLRDT